MSDAADFNLAPTWRETLTGSNRAALKALSDYMPTCRWFGGKARHIRQTSIVSAVQVGEAYIANVLVEYTEGEPQTYVLPLLLAHGVRAGEIEEGLPQAVIARLPVGETSVVLYDASWDTSFAAGLLEAIKESRSFEGTGVTLVAWPTIAFEEVLGPASASIEPKILRAQQSNTSIAYGDRAILKLFRRLEEGTSPELEIGRFLDKNGFRHTPPLAGALEYRQAGGEPLTLAILQGFVPNQGDAWQWTLDALDDYFAYAMSQRICTLRDAGPATQPLDLLGREMPDPVREALGPYAASARLLGRRTAEMHLTLASDSLDPAFSPEPVTSGYLRDMYNSVEELTDTAFGLLENRMAALGAEARETAGAVLSRRTGILEQFRLLLGHEVTATRLRCHGDYHLGQALYTGSDFVIIDFEGEPVRSLPERRIKHSPLKDVAGMLRSFHYAAYAAMFTRVAEGLVASEELAGIERWADAWHRWVGAAFLGEYLEVAADGDFLPRRWENLHTLLDVYLLEKAVYELIYELNNRPDWVRIPLQGIEELVG